MQKFSALLLLLLIGCERNELQHPITGEWRWVSTTGGFAGQTIRPKAGDDVLMRFTPEKTFEVRTNQVLS
jgi:hypothetical protein